MWMVGGSMRRVTADPRLKTRGQAGGCVQETLITSGPQAERNVCLLAGLMLTEAVWVKWILPSWVSGRNTQQGQQAEAPCQGTNDTWTLIILSRDTKIGLCRMFFPRVFFTWKSLTEDLPCLHVDDHMGSLSTTVVLFFNHQLPAPKWSSSNSQSV